LKEAAIRQSEYLKNLAGTVSGTIGQ